MKFLSLLLFIVSLFLTGTRLASDFFTKSVIYLKDGKLIPNGESGL